MIGSNPTIPDSSRVYTNGNRIARLRFGSRCSFLTTAVCRKRDAKVCIQNAFQEKTRYTKRNGFATVSKNLARYRKSKNNFV